MSEITVRACLFKLDWSSGLVISPTSFRCPVELSQLLSPLALAPGQRDEVSRGPVAVGAETVVFVLACDPRAKAGHQPGSPKRNHDLRTYR